MSAHVLLNLLNELRKRDKMRGLPRILLAYVSGTQKNRLIDTVLLSTHNICFA